MGARCRVSTPTLWPCAVAEDCVEDAIGETRASLPAPQFVNNSSGASAKRNLRFF